MNYLFQLLPSNIYFRQLAQIKLYGGDMMRPPTIIINVCSGVLIARRHANYVLISRGSVTQRPSCYNNVINGPHYIWCVDTLIQPSHHQPPGPQKQNTWNSFNSQEVVKISPPPSSSTPKKIIIIDILTSLPSSHFNWALEICCGWGASQ